MTRPGQVDAQDSFGTRASLNVDGTTYSIHSLAGLDHAVLPYTLRIVLENLLRHEDGVRVSADQVRALLDWGHAQDHTAALDISPSRVFLHDTNGVPVVADLAAMRHAMSELGLPADRVNPQVPAELVIDHSVI